MDFKQFELAAKCYYCRRPFHTFAPNLNPPCFLCDCSMSNKFFQNDGYLFVLPLSHDIEIQINSDQHSCKIIDCSLQNPLFEDSNIPAFIFAPKAELIKKIKNLFVFL